MPASKRLRTSDGLLNQIGPAIRQRMQQLQMSNDALCVALAEVTNGEWVLTPIDVTHIMSGRRIVTTVELVGLAVALGTTSGDLLGVETRPTPRRVKDANG